MKTIYLYGMRLRGYSPGAQPKGIYERRDDKTGKYYDVIAYTNKLSELESRRYELDYIGTEKV